MFVLIEQYIEHKNYECDPSIPFDTSLLVNAKLKCEGNPNCHMFVDYLGSGVKFKMCPPGSSRIRASKGSILYTKGNIEKYAIHKILKSSSII